MADFGLEVWGLGYGERNEGLEPEGKAPGQRVRGEAPEADDSFIIQ